MVTDYARVWVYGRYNKLIYLLFIGDFRLIHPVLFSNELIEMRQTRFGYMAYLKNDIFIGQALSRYGEYSYFEFDLFRQLVQPGQTVIDVGANSGCHSLALASLVGPMGRVLAFEPQPVVNAILNMNFMLNQAVNMQVYSSPLSNQHEKLFMPTIDYLKQGNFGDVAFNAEPNTHPSTFFSTTLDDYGLRDCHFIKIDVQGAELRVLLGADKLIQSCRPVLYVENDRIEGSSDLIQFLLQHQYRLFWHAPPLFNLNNFFANSENIYPGIVSINMLAMPAERPINCDLEEITDPEDNCDKFLSRHKSS